MSNQGKIDAAREAIQEVFGDTSVTPEVTRDSLEELAGLIESLLDALPKD